MKAASGGMRAGEGREGRKVQRQMDMLKETWVESKRKGERVYRFRKKCVTEMDVLKRSVEGR